MKILWNLIYAAFILHRTVFCAQISKHVIASFTDPTGDRSIVNNHLAVHKDTGILYIGAFNRIFRLDQNLRLLTFTRTDTNKRETEKLVEKSDETSIGESEEEPKEESEDWISLHNSETYTPECPNYEDCLNDATETLTNNVNKALMIDYNRSRLIACGSGYQGACWILSLDDVSISLSEFIDEPIVANNERASTVAFIAPGPPLPTPTMVMYVGVTYTGSSIYTDDVPAVSSRSLDPRDNFQILKDSVLSGTKIHFSQRKSYPINYVYGFSSGGFSYFMTTQKKDLRPTSPYISKLVRVCQNDSNYYSYTEIPMECVSETTGRKFDLVQAAFLGKPGPDLADKLDVTYQDDLLFAAFLRSYPHGSSMAGKESAICVYSLKDIRRKFLENIALCFQGKGNRGLAFITTDIPCISTRLKVIDEDFCGMDVNTPLGGKKPVVAVSILNFTAHITSIAATDTGNYTVVFLGTNDGYLKKVVVESGKSGTEYDDQVIDPGNRVLSDMFFDLTKSHLYVMTERKISKVPVHNCSEYTTCNDCVSAGDPYCGWCSLQNKCTLANNCQKDINASDLTPYWISYKSGLCARITMVTPNQLQSSTTGTLAVNIEHLSTRSGEFWCVFRFAFGKTLMTPANLTSNGVICYTPPASDLPPIPPQQHNLTATLSVGMSQDGSNCNDFVASNFVFFDCNTYTTCTTCVNSSFPCDWCVDKHRCTHDTAKNCRNDILVTGLNRVGPSIRSGPGFCPRINVTNRSPELLVPHGATKKIEVKVDNIAQQIIVTTRFSCRFKIEGHIVPANAQLVENTMYCDAIPFNYYSPAPNITVPFAVVWGGGQTKSLDNPDNIHILVYRCRAMADNCGMCLVMDEKYGCGWCQSSSTCQVGEQCDNGTGVWLSRIQTCPNPEIRSFYPRLGPWEGGTNLTIEGINLGKTFDDIYYGVTVAGVPCAPYRHLYSKTQRIVCRLDGSGNNEPKVGPIIVKVANFRAKSATKYRFVDPKIRSISPTNGPMNGGTKIKIYGEYLNVGNRMQVLVGNITCKVLRSTNSSLECQTGISNWKGRFSLIATFDFQKRVFKPGFSYVENPIIWFNKKNPIRIIPAGGLNVQILGQNFNAIQNAEIYIIWNGTYYSGPCNTSETHEMFCLTPKISVEHDIKIMNESNGVRLQYGFLLDSVNYFTEYYYLLLYPNPKIYKFKGGLKTLRGDLLTMNGENLNDVLGIMDFEVLVGNNTCNVTALTRNELTCKLPLKFYMGFVETFREGRILPSSVEVKIGPNLRYVLGDLQVESASEPSQTHLYITVGFVILFVIIVLIIAITVVVITVYKRKSERSTRTIEQMQKRVYVLELKAAIDSSVTSCSEGHYEEVSENIYETIDEPAYLTPIKHNVPVK